MEESKKMKILVPLNNDNYLKRYIEAGADELYLGFYDEKWNKNFGEFSDINRMSGFKKMANQHSFKEAMHLVSKIKEMDRGAYITLNANCYSKSQIKYIKKYYFPEILDSQADGLIVSDLWLAIEAYKFGIPVVASTMCGIYNSDIALVYKKSGIKRVILPRDLSLDEIESICKKNPEMEYEVFFMRNGCIFSDSYCLGMHREECGGSTCGFVRFSSCTIKSDYTDFKNIHDMELNHDLYNYMFHHEACAMCALYRMEKIGVNALKIVGRADICEDICEDILLAKENLFIVKQCKNEEEYLSRMKLPKNASKKCRLGFSCYYPEVRFEN